MLYAISKEDANVCVKTLGSNVGLEAAQSGYFVTDEVLLPIYNA